MKISQIVQKFPLIVIETFLYNLKIMGCIADSETASKPQPTVAFISIKVLFFASKGIGLLQIIKKYVHGTARVNRQDILQMGIYQTKSIDMDVSNSNYRVISDPSARKVNISAYLKDTGTPAQFKNQKLCIDLIKQSNIIVFLYKEGKQSSIKELQDVWIPHALKHVKPATRLYLIGNCKNIEQQSDGATHQKVAQLANKHGLAWKRVDFVGESVKIVFDEILKDTACQRIQPKDMFMSLMLGLNEDIDDDLLHDAMALLTDDL